MAELDQDPRVADEDGGSRRSPLVRRKRMLLLVIGAAVLLGVGGLVGATFVKSPAQLAAEQRPVTPTVLTAPVKRQVVGATVVLRGTVGGSREVQVTPVPSAGGTGGGAGAGGPLLTAVRKPEGATVNAGESILEVSGRPLVALAGDEPAYRDLRPGDTGKDVTMLRRALEQLGFSTAGDPPNRFGVATKRAVRSYYERLGFAVPTVEGGDAQLQAAQDAVTQAKRRLRDAQDGPGGNAVEDARADLRTAEQRLAELDAKTGPMVPQAEFVFLPTFPARVIKLGGTIGRPVQAPLVTLSSGELQVNGRLDPADRGLVQPGAAVEIDSEVTGFRGTGKITAVGDQAGPANGSDVPQGQDQGQGQGQGQGGTPYVPVTVTPDAPLDSRAAGQDVRLTVRFGQTAEPVLAVPSSAITSSADGRTQVVVVDAAGAQRTIDVRTGKSGAGFVEVSPVSAELAEGDRVVIGR